MKQVSIYSYISMDTHLVQKVNPEKQKSKIIYVHQAWNSTFSLTSFWGSSKAAAALQIHLIPSFFLPQSSTSPRLPPRAWTALREKKEGINRILNAAATSSPPQKQVA